MSLQCTVIAFVDDTGLNINGEDCEEKINKMTGTCVKEYEEAGVRMHSRKTRSYC